jgi:hypothetical protein
MSTLIRWPKPRYCVPLFVPLLKWFLGHKGTTRDTEGDKKQAVFIGVFYFVQENPEGKDRSGGERSNPLSYAGLNKMACFKEMNRSVPLFVTLFVPLVKYVALWYRARTERD